MKHSAPRVDDALVDRVAQEADTDRRSVIRRLAGLPVRGRAGRRIDQVLELGAAADRGKSGRDLSPSDSGR